METRSGYRELDDLVERSADLGRQAKDRDRAVPRATSAPVGHPRKVRSLPPSTTARVPLSSRQRKARNVAKRAAQDTMPTAQYQALSTVVTHEDRWRSLNDQLSEHVGDVQMLEEADRREVQRIDRAIQTGERHNDRGHVLYANVQLPSYVNHTSLHAVVDQSFRPGDAVEFDRFTATAHTMHETEASPGQEMRSFAFEIQTRRGLYLGRSDSVDDTRHLLPRGMRFKVRSTHQAEYRRPDGSTARRWVVQLIDVGSNETRED